MNDLLVERFFIVAVELTDGRSTQLKVRGETRAEAFKEVRARADVRRVGKITEIDERAFHSDRPMQSARPGGAANGQPAERRTGFRTDSKPDHSARHQGDRPEAAAAPKTPREALIGFTISGPRVIRAAKPLGYEQPFKNFRARPDAVNLPPPPEVSRTTFSPFGPVKGPVANDPSRPPVFAKAVPAASAPAAEAPSDALSKPVRPQLNADAKVSTPVQRDYRIQKSRRQGGEPYLLQRGTWSVQKGKRVLAVEWEKGFSSRETAEKQQAWLKQMAAEAAELQSEE